jgi:hypothetical protein
MHVIANRLGHFLLQGATLGFIDPKRCLDLGIRGRVLSYEARLERLLARTDVARKTLLEERAGATPSA